MKAIRNDINFEIDVRKMSDEEIDNSQEQRYCDDETCCIYRESELTLLPTPVTEGKT